MRAPFLTRIQRRAGDAAIGIAMVLAVLFALTVIHAFARF